jgi:hypothetical protein
MLTIAVMITACVPEEHKDVLPYCQEQYQDLLDSDPEFPPAFIGACVSYWQSEKPTAFVSLCGYEPIWEMLNEEYDANISSRKQCINFIKSLGD